MIMNFHNEGLHLIIQPGTRYVTPLAFVPIEAIVFFFLIRPT